LSSRIAAPNRLIVVVGALLLSTVFFGVAGLVTVYGSALTDSSEVTPTGAEDESSASPRGGIGNCPESFECTTVNARVDQHGSDPGGTIPVTFAVLPARGNAEGAFITIVGGPGASGIDAAAYLAPAMERVRDRYDLVFFDIRGLETWESVDCPIALAENNRRFGFLPTDPEERWISLNELSEDFGDECTSEAKQPLVLEHLRTIDIAEDIEEFRRHAGYDKVVLYGESYGTQVAQEYARNHPDRVERMILDAVVDRTRNVIESAADQIEAFEDSLDLVFQACDKDSWCSADMNDPSAAAYRRLVDELAASPAIVALTRSNAPGKLIFTADDLGYLAYSSLYDQPTRMLFLRALAAYASTEDLAPMARLYDATISPGGFAIDTIVYTAVSCSDWAYPAETTEGMQLIASDARDKVTPDVKWFFEGVAGCIHWPHIELPSAPDPPFPAFGIPTLVLASDADVATPYLRSLATVENFIDGHLITVRNGPHVVFGRGIECVDTPVVNFALDGTPPANDECEVEIMSPYATLLPVDWTGYEPEAMISSAENEIYWFPEFFFWSGINALTVECNLDGEATFEGDFDVTTFELDGCALNEGLILSGIGEFDSLTGLSSLDVTLEATGCRYTYRYDWATETVDFKETC
jgi:pimeloyl-ACP methyl ester carboxylesterase